MPNIKLQTSDGEVFCVDMEVARFSGTIRTILETLDAAEDEEEVVPLPNVNSEILRKVITWATHQKEEQASLEKNKDKEKGADEKTISIWDTDFLNKLDHGTLFELLVAANSLDIKGLLDLTCTKVAGMIKGKKPEEIRQAFNVKNDFTDAELAQVHKENEWCEEK